MRQPLKRLDELFDPDIRHSYFVSSTGAARSIEQHYLGISRIALITDVPESIREQFETVRNLFVYSWYVYDFTVPACIYAKTLVEKSLKHRFKAEFPSTRKFPSLRQLLDHAIGAGWLLNKHFAYAMEWVQQDWVLDAGDRPDRQRKQKYDPGGNDYCRIIVETFPNLRNFDMHGQAGLLMPGQALQEIEICACIINALFPACIPPDALPARPVNA